MKKKTNKKTWNDFVNSITSLPPSTITVPVGELIYVDYTENYEARVARERSEYRNKVIDEILKDLD